MDDDRRSDRIVAGLVLAFVLAIFGPCECAARPAISDGQTGSE